MGYDGVAAGFQVGGLGNQHVVGFDSMVFQALAIGHDRIGHRDFRAVVHAGTKETETLGFHHVARTEISEYRASLFQLDHSGKNLRSRSRRAVYQNDQLSRKIYMVFML